MNKRLFSLTLFCLLILWLWKQAPTSLLTLYGCRFNSPPVNIFLSVNNWYPCSGFALTRHIWVKSQSLQFRACEVLLCVHFHCLPPSSTTSLFMVFLMCPDGSCLLHSSRRVWYNKPWWKQFHVWLILAGEERQVWPVVSWAGLSVSEVDSSAPCVWFPITQVMNMIIEAQSSLLCQSGLSQVKWHVLWKRLAMSWCKCSREMDRRNTIKGSYEACGPLGSLAANSKQRLLQK